MAQEFQYEALTLEGEKKKGSITAEDEAQAKAQLAAQGLALLSIASVAGSASGEKKRFDVAALLNKKPTTKELILFTKQFRTLYVSGISVTEIFKTLSEQTENRVMRRVLLDIDRRVKEGQSLHEAFSANGQIFSPLYCSMIAAGEASGAMSDVIARLTYIMDHEERIQLRMASATRYPKIVTFVMFAAFLVLLNFVIPKFASVFQKAHMELPLPTRIAIDLNYFCSEYWWLALILSAGAVIGFKYALGTHKGRLLWESFALKVPLIGTVIKKAVIARFSSIFGILQRSGISIIDTFEILKKTINNLYFSSQFDDVIRRIQAGESIAGALSNVNGFSALAISLIAVGERSGNIDAMMEELAKHYDEEVEYSVDQMTEYIGPVLILCLGVVLLFFALAIFLPMWNMTALAAG